MTEKPYINMEFYIAGLKHYRYQDVANVLEVGTEVTLVPEPTNQYDPNAVMIMYDGVMLGYVPARSGEAQLVAKALSLEAELLAEISKLDLENPQIHRRIKVWIKELAEDEEGEDEEYDDEDDDDDIPF